MNIWSDQEFVDNLFKKPYKWLCESFNKIADILNSGVEPRRLPRRVFKPASTEFKHVDERLLVPSNYPITALVGLTPSEAFGGCSGKLDHIKSEDQVLALMFANSIDVDTAFDIVKNYHFNPTDDVFNLINNALKTLSERKRPMPLLLEITDISPTLYTSWDDDDIARIPAVRLQHKKIFTDLSRWEAPCFPVA